MKVLVTGASGFIGRAMVRKLAHDSRHEVVGLCRQNSSRSRIEVETLIGPDLTLPEAQSIDLQGFDAVVHLAGSATSESSHQSAAESGHARIVAQLCRMAVRDGVSRVIHVSSIKVHGESTPEFQPVTEQSAFAPQDQYSVAKLQAERVLLGFSSSVETVIVRPPLVYGREAGGNFRRLVGLARLRIPKPLGGVSNARSMIFVENLVHFLSLCIDHKAAAGESFVVSDGEDIGSSALLRLIASVQGIDPWLFDVSPKWLNMAGRITGQADAVARLIESMRVDAAHARSLLDWTPPYTLTQGITRAVGGQASTGANAE